MEFAPDDVLTWPYYKRQFIVVDDDMAVELVQRVAKDDVERGLAANVIGGAARGMQSRYSASEMATGAVLGAVVATAKHLGRIRKLADDVDLPCLVVTTTQAHNLQFSLGHPLPNVVYAGDPEVAGLYYPVADFHRVLFESKVAEALRLLRWLGVTDVSLEYVEGFDRAGDVEFSIAPPAGTLGELGVGANQTSKERSGAKWTARYVPTAPPQIPTDLVWFNSEPLWQEVAHARLESGLREFTLELNYTGDFGINANLTAKIASVGLEAGGKFTAYKDTTWKVAGTFGELPPPASEEP